jgi:hypothetical protein
MSAFVCSDRHIATIACHFATLLPGQDAQRIADELKAINIASVNWRYPNHPQEPFEPCNLADLSAAALSFPDLVALCECLDYQSCELPDYSNPLLDQITAQFKDNVRHGVKSAMWSI